LILRAAASLSLHNQLSVIVFHSGSIVFSPKPKKDSNFFFFLLRDARNPVTKMQAKLNI
jgi:hypothetical protein